MAETKVHDFLEKERLGKLMWKYAIPCVISMLVAALYNIVDQIFIANASYLGSYGNAANTVVFPMTVVAIAIAVMIGDGCCTFVSISLGAKEPDNARRGIGSSILAVIAVSLVLMGIYLVFQEPILSAFGARVNDETFTREIVFGAGLPILLPMLWRLYALPFFMPVADILTFIAVAVVLYQTQKGLKLPCQTDPDAESAAGFVPSASEALTNTIVTLGRSYGSGGRSVGRLLSERLHIPYYDAALLEEAAKRSGMSQKFLAGMDEKPLPVNMLYQYPGFLSNQYSSFQEQANQAQREVIEAVAQQGPCVIVGRRADQILKEYPNVFKVFITAPKQSRIRRISQRDGLKENESAQKLSAVDKERAAYYNQSSDKRWGSADSYDLCIDTEQLGIEGAVDTILAAIAVMDRK